MKTIILNDYVSVTEYIGDKDVSDFITIEDYDTIDGNRQSVNIYMDDLQSFINILNNILAIGDIDNQN